MAKYWANNLVTLDRAQISGRILGSTMKDEEEEEEEEEEEVRPF